MKSFLFSLLSLLLILSHLQVSEGCNPCQGNQLSSSGGFGKFYPRFLGNWVYIRDYDGNPEFYCSNCAGLRAYAVRIQRVLYYRENFFHKKTFPTSSTLQMLILIKFPKTISCTQFEKTAVHFDEFWKDQTCIALSHPENFSPCVIITYYTKAALLTYTVLCSPLYYKVMRCSFWKLWS